MCAMGQERTFAGKARMSALPPIADIDPQSADIRFVPKADIAHPFGCVGNYCSL